jgi:hypothetical protein
MFASVKSVAGHTMAHIFCTDFGFVKLTSMTLKSEAASALQELIQDIGIPKCIHTDEAKELTLGEWKKKCRGTVLPCPIQNPIAHGKTKRKEQSERSNAIHCV